VGNRRLHVTQVKGFWEIWEAKVIGGTCELTQTSTAASPVKPNRPKKTTEVIISSELLDRGAVITMEGILKDQTYIHYHYGGQSTIVPHMYYPNLLFGIQVLILLLMPAILIHMEAKLLLHVVSFYWVYDFCKYFGACNVTKARKSAGTRVHYGKMEHVTNGVCNLKVYLVWTGTDASGVNCESWSYAPSQFSKFSAESVFQTAAGGASQDYFPSNSYN